MSTGTRRLLVAAGTAHYDDDELADLPGVDTDLDRVRASFAAFGCSTGLRLLDPTADGLRMAVADWARAEYRGDDIVVLYYSGHGATAGSRHFLMCRDSESGQMHSTAVEAERLVQILVENGFTRILLVIDTCFAAQAAVDAVRGFAKEIATHPGIDTSRLVALSVIAAARVREEAEDGAFAEALHRAVTSFDLGGHRQRAIHLEPLVARIRELMPAGRPQHVSLSMLLGGDVAFLPNPRYVAGLPVQSAVAMDLAEQATFAGPEGSRRRAELLAHFAPRGTATDGMPGDTSYFTGRTLAVAHLAGWLEESAQGPGRHVVVTGGPGTGKSALIGRLVLLARTGGAARPESSAEQEPAGVVHAAIHARHLRLDEIVAGIAAAAGLPGHHLATLLTGLAERRQPLFVVIDALDEAGGPDASREGVRIATALLCPLAELPCVRLLVGTRRLVVSALGDAFAPIDLDDNRWSDAGQIEEYARRLLAAPHGPASTSPYTRNGIARAEVAREIALHCPDFLTARLLARTLAQQERAVDLNDAGWRDRLRAPWTRGARPESPDAPMPAFRWALRETLGDRQEWGLALLGALALAEGDGLPAGPVWTAMARAVAGTAVDDRDIGWILGAAAAHLVETTDSHGRSLYRLFHESFAEEIRALISLTTRRNVALALLDTIPCPSDTGERDWAAADPYLLAHLAAHLAPHDLLVEIVNDPLYLLTVEPNALVTTLADALPRLRRDPAQAETTAACDAWLRCVPLLRDQPDRTEAAAQLHLAAMQTSADRLAAAVAARFPDLPWKMSWAHLTPAAPHRAIGSFTSPVKAVAPLTAQGRTLLATAEESGRVRLWDFTTGEEHSELPRPPGGPADDLIAYHDEGAAWLLIRAGNTVSVWDVVTGLQVGSTFTSPGRHSTDPLQWCALTRFRGDPVAALLHSRGRVHLVDVRAGCVRGRWKAASWMGERAQSGGIACTVHEETLLIATGVYWDHAGSIDDGDLAPSTERTVRRWSVAPHPEQDAKGHWAASEVRSAQIGGSGISRLALHEQRIILVTQWPPREGRYAAGHLDEPWVKEVPEPLGALVDAIMTPPGSTTPMFLVREDGTLSRTTVPSARHVPDAVLATGDVARPMAVVTFDRADTETVTTTASGGPLKVWTLTGDGGAQSPRSSAARATKGAFLTLARADGRTIAVTRGMGAGLTGLDIHSGRVVRLPATLRGHRFARGDADLPLTLLPDDRRPRDEYAAALADGRRRGIPAPPDGEPIVTALDASAPLLVRFGSGAIQVWDAGGTRIAQRRPRLRVRLQLFGDPGTVVLTAARYEQQVLLAVAGHQSTTIPIYALPGLEPFGTVRLRHQPWPLDTDDGGRPVIALGLWQGKPVFGSSSRGWIKVIDPATGERLQRVNIARQDVTALRLFTVSAPDGGLGEPLPVAAVCADDTFLLLDGRDGARLRSVFIGSRIMDWAWAGEGQVLLRTMSGVFSLHWPSSRLLAV